MTQNKLPSICFYSEQTLCAQNRIVMIGYIVQTTEQVNGSGSSLVNEPERSRFVARISLKRSKATNKPRG
jgi:hypothetical protein